MGHGACFRKMHFGTRICRTIPVCPFWGHHKPPRPSAPPPPPPLTSAPGHTVQRNTPRNPPCQRGEDGGGGGIRLDGFSEGPMPGGVGQVAGQRTAPCPAPMGARGAIMDRGTPAGFWDLVRRPLIWGPGLPPSSTRTEPRPKPIPQPADQEQAPGPAGPKGCKDRRADGGARHGQGEAAEVRARRGGWDGR